MTRFPLAVCLLLFATFVSSQEPLCASDTRFHRGMTLGLFSDGNGARYLKDLRELDALGVDSVSLHVAWGLPHVRSMSFGPREDMTPSDARLRGAIRAAHRRGMRVLLFPLLFVDHLEEGEWRGVLAPPDLDRWWSEYERFVLHYANIASEEGVHMLSLGSELCAMEESEERWRALASRVRKTFSGKLTYSANWDHLEPVLAWADALDFVGMNAYHEVGKEPDLPAMQARWKEVRADLEAWQKRHGRPVLITEVGYPSRSGGTATPWDYTVTGQPDMEEQALGYRLFLDAWEGAEYLSGVYFYLWWGEGGPRDTGYTPRNKPAAKVLSEWYQRD